MRKVAGVDIGSTTAKTVILDEQGHILTYNVVEQGIVNEASAENSFRQALDRTGLTIEKLEYVITTGYGRNLVKFGNENITEISCHARGAYFLSPQVRTIIDIGGQDSKTIAINEAGKIVSFGINDKCAAGTGRFLEVMSRALGVRLDSMGTFSLQSKNPARVASMCTVFAETEIVSLSAQGHDKIDIIAGLHEAVSRRIVNLARSTTSIKPRIMVTGGVAKNKGVVKALERLLDREIIVPEEPQIVGALGAAIIALGKVKPLLLG